MIMRDTYVRADRLSAVGALPGTSSVCLLPTVYGLVTAGGRYGLDTQP
jgi:hypothetical protein